jgi:TrmH family RNA methyltransferase
MNPTTTLAAAMSRVNIRIVLVRPTHPGNIGAAARAMKNMCLTQLYVVAPERFPHPEAVARAADAADLVSQAVICSTLEEAIGDCQLVVGTSARARRIDWPALSPPECARQLTSAAERGAVALLFGQERTGLTNAELDRCQYMVSIPVNPDSPSLNLAAAVQILAYEIYLAGFESRSVPVGVTDNTTVAATQEDLQRLYEHLETVLVEIGFLDLQNPRRLMRRLVRLFNRAGLDQNELNILRGMLTAVQTRRRDQA